MSRFADFDFPALKPNKPDPVAPLAPVQVQEGNVAEARRQLENNRQVKYGDQKLFPAILESGDPTFGKPAGPVQTGPLARGGDGNIGLGSRAFTNEEYEQRKQERSNEINRDLGFDPKTFGQIVGEQRTQFGGDLASTTDSNNPFAAAMAFNKNQFATQKALSEQRKQSQKLMSANTSAKGMKDWADYKSDNIKPWTGSGNLIDRVKENNREQLRQADQQSRAKNQKQLKPIEDNFDKLSKQLDQSYGSQMSRLDEQEQKIKSSRPSSTLGERLASNTFNSFTDDMVGDLKNPFGNLFSL